MTVPSRLRRVVVLTLLVVGPLTAIGLADVLLAPTEAELAEECSSNAKQVYSPDPVTSTVAAIRELANAGLDEVAAARLEALAETIESPPKGTPTLAELAAGGRALAADCEPAARTWPEWVAQRTDVALGRITGPLTDDPGGLRLGEGATKAVEAVAWLLPLLVALLFIRQVRMLFADREPGPVEVLPVSVATRTKGPSKDPPGTDPPAGAVLDADSASNVLRIALGSAGLSPGSLTPGGLGTQKVDATTALSELPGPEWLAALLKAMRSAVSPARGYLLQTSLVPTPRGGWSAAIQLQHKRSGSTLMSEQVEDGSGEAVLQRAAFRVHQRLHEEPEVRRRTAGQLIWTSGGARGLELYQAAKGAFDEAQAHEDSYARDGAKLRAALELAELAVYLEPGNLPARVLVGDCHVRLAQRRQRSSNAQRVLDALRTYLRKTSAPTDISNELGEAWAAYLRTPTGKTAQCLVTMVDTLAQRTAKARSDNELANTLRRYFGLEDEAVTDATRPVPRRRDRQAEREVLAALEGFVDSTHPTEQEAGDELVLAWTAYLDAPGRPAADRAEHYVDALEAYLEAVFLDPGLSETRIRLASVLTYAPDWASTWATDYLPEDRRLPGTPPRQHRDAHERRRRRAQGRRVVALLDELHRRDRSTGRPTEVSLGTRGQLRGLAERQLTIALRRIRFTAVASRWLRLATRDSVRGAVWPASRRRRSVKDFILAIRAGVRASVSNEPWPTAIDQLDLIRVRRFRRLAGGDHVARYDLAFAYYELGRSSRPWRWGPWHWAPRHWAPRRAVDQLEVAHRGPDHALSRADLVYVASDPDWDPIELGPTWHRLASGPSRPVAGPGVSQADRAGTGPDRGLREVEAYRLWWERLSRETRRTVTSTATAGQAWAEIGTAADRMAALWAHRIGQVAASAATDVEEVRLFRSWYETELELVKELQTSLAGPSQSAERRGLLERTENLLRPTVTLPAPLSPPADEGSPRAFSATASWVREGEPHIERSIESLTSRMTDPFGGGATRGALARARLRFWEDLRRQARAPSPDGPKDAQGPPPDRPQ